MSDPIQTKSIFEDQIETCGSCIEIKQCLQLKRVIKALVYYQSLNMEETKNELVAFCTNTYKYLLDDFNHIIMVHNNNNEEIHQYLLSDYSSLFSCCNVSKCAIYKRSNRNREHSDNESETDNIEFMFWRDLFDRIHSYLIHLYDSPLRIEKSKLDINDNDKKSDDVICLDTTFDSICQAVELKRKKLSNDSHLFDRFKSQKFSIIANTQIVDEKTEEKQSTAQSINEFSIGYTFYYWKYYKNKKKKKKTHISKIRVYNTKI
eukprot:35970_1